MFYINFACRSLIERRRQYRALFAVCTAAVSIIMSVMILTDGMLSAFTDKAKQYYGGDIQFIGGTDYGMTDADTVASKIKAVLPASVLVYKRFDYDATASSFYFEGVEAKTKIFKGVDFAAEQKLFSRFTFSSGSAQVRDSHDSMIISEPVAQKLGIHTGDSVTVMTQTIYGYNNTMNLVVTGIFQDSSLFGMYTTYMDIGALRKLTGYPDGYVNRIGLYDPQRELTKADAERMQTQFEKIFNMYPLTKDKYAFFDALKSDTYKKPLYALITLDANREELAMMTGALRMIVMLIIIPLLLIVAVGIGSSYRVIVLKRTVETGTFRAIGMRPSGVIRLFLSETLFLLIAGFISGILCSILVTGIASQFNLSFIPAFDIFLQGGHLAPVLHPLKVTALLGIILVSTLVSVLFTLRSLIHVSPMGALVTTV